MTNEKEDESIKILLGLLDYHNNHYTLQREVLDRWFRFYLFIVAATLATLTALVKTVIIDFSNPAQKMYLGFACILLFFLGLTFFFMNTVQRANSVNYVRLKLNPIEFALWNKCSDLIPIKSRDLNANRFGADFAVGLVIAIVNTVWIVGALFFLLDLFNRELTLDSLAFFLFLVPFLQMIFRFIYLSKIEVIKDKAQKAPANAAGPRH